MTKNDQKWQKKCIFYQQKTKIGWKCDWEEVKIFRHLDLENLYRSLPDSRFVYFTTKSEKIYTEFQFQDDDCLIFGRETRGLPEDLLKANWERALTIPMPNENVRSLNLATSVGIVLYEALRQVNFSRIS